MNSGYASIVDKPAAILQKIEIIVSPTLKGKQVYLRLLQFPQTTCVLDESMFERSVHLILNWCDSTISAKFHHFRLILLKLTSRSSEVNEVHQFLA